MASESGGKGAGVGVLGLLGVAFVVLKLCGVIDWEWVYVLMPFWVPVAIGMFILLIVGLLWAVAMILDRR